MKRTPTGILSNCRPVEGAPATSVSRADYGFDRHNLISTSKRDTAKRVLYSRFFRGPVLGPNSIAEEERLASLHTQTPKVQDAKIENRVTKYTVDLESIAMDGKVARGSIKRRDTKEDNDGGRNEEVTRRWRKKRRKKVEEGRKRGRK